MSSWKRIRYGGRSIALHPNDTVIGVRRVTLERARVDRIRVRWMGQLAIAPQDGAPTEGERGIHVIAKPASWSPEPPLGCPQAYLPRRGRAEAGALSRSTKDEQGKKRNLSYPPAPEPLPFGVPDNHTHLDFRDGSVHVTVAQALDAANAVGVPGVIQVGCDVESSEFAVRAASAGPAGPGRRGDPPQRCRAPGRAPAELDAAIARIEELAGA